MKLSQPTSSPWIDSTKDDFHNIKGTKQSDHASFPLRNIGGFHEKGDKLRPFLPAQKRSVQKPVFLHHADPGPFILYYFLLFSNVWRIDCI